jgi:hypothetical protein
MVLGWIRESFRGGIAMGCCGACCKKKQPQAPQYQYHAAS